jgi:uncharacterized membrane protein
MTDKKEAKKADDLALDRIIFFSDAIIAVAITLMVLDIRVPEGLSPPEVPQAVLALWPKYLSYVISFVVIAIYWVEHHRMFKYIKRYDGRLMWLNLLFLMFMALIPFSTDLLAEYGNEPVAVMTYAGIGFAVGLSKAGVWWYATHNRRLVDEALSSHSIDLSGVIGLVAPLVFLVSMGIALVSTSWAVWSWITIGPLIFLTHWVMDRRR